MVPYALKTITQNPYPGINKLDIPCQQEGRSGSLIKLITNNNK